MRIAFAAVLVALTLLPGSGVGQSPKAPEGAPPKAGAAQAPQPAAGETTWGGKTLDKWILELKNPDASKRTMALLALMHFGEAASKAIPHVLDRLHDSDVSPRAKAALVLRYLAVDPKHVNSVVKELGGRLYPPGTNRDYGESQAVIRYEAAKTLQALHPRCRAGHSRPGPGHQGPLVLGNPSHLH